MADDTKKVQRRGLGRGLSALMADIETPSEATAQQNSATNATRTLPIESLNPNPDQPRRQFEKDALEELAESVRARGIIQPLVVRSRGDVFEIVAGERRWRAAQMAQLHEVPVVVRDFTDEEVLEIAIIENIQREDLNAIEEALGFQQLMQRFGHTQEKMASALGKSRSHIANLLRLLNLPEPVQALVQNGDLSAGHARALVTAPDPEAAAKTVVAKGLSVRETERLVKNALNPATDKPAKSNQSRAANDKDADTKALEADLSAALGMKVSITHDEGKESGRVSVSYDTLEQLDALCMILSSHR